VTAPALDAAANSDILQSRAQLSFDGGADVDISVEHAVTVLNATPNVLLDISTARSPAIAGNTLLYTLTVSNVSFQAVNNVKVLYRVPRGIQFHQTTDAEPDTSLNCTSLVCNEGEEAWWTFPILAAGASVTININAQVAAGLLDGTLISTPISVTLDEMENTLQVLHTVPVDNNVAAQLSLSADKDPVMPGETYTLNLDLGNISGNILTNTQLRAFLPDGVTVNSASDGGIITSSSSSNSEVRWDLSTVGVGATLHREIIVTAPALDAAANSDILQSRAQLSFDGGADVDISAEHAVTVLDATPPLAILITATPDPVATGNTLVFTITVNNVSALPINNINVLYRVPSGIQFHQIADAEPDTSLNCTSLVCNEGEEAWWTFPALAAGASETIIINAQIAAGLLDGTLISVPITATANELIDTINVLYSVSIAN